MSVTVAVAAVLLSATTGGAEVGTTSLQGDCVTRSEYRQARFGMTKVRVHRIFGTPGTRVYVVVDNEEKRTYPMCDPSLRLNVTYIDGRLAYKDLRD
jgi:hypothetical protein